LGITGFFFGVDAMDIRKADETEEYRAKVKALVLRMIAKVGPPVALKVELVPLCMIPEPAEVQLASVEGEPVVPHKRPRNEEGTTFLHQFPNRRARRAKK
jgi:hypothetical protein